MRYIESTMTTKICTKCKDEKDLTLFGEYFDNRKGKFFPHSKCIECKAEYDKEYRANLDKDQVKEYQKNYRIENEIELKKYKKQYRIDNKDFYDAYNKQYNIENKDAISEQKKQYYKENKDDIIESHTIYTRGKRKNDPIFRLRNNVSRLIHFYLFKNGTPKNGKSILDFLEYTIIQLKLHLESLFEPWMTWQNYGVFRVETWKDDDNSTWTWHIDHIIPHSKFNYTSMEDQEFKDCWALSNLRPLSAKQNLSDGNRR